MAKEIVVLPDGKKYVRADRQVFFGNDPEAWADQFDLYFYHKIRKNEDVVLQADDGSILLLTKDTQGKATFRNYVRDENGVFRRFTDDEYLTKLNAEAHIDELTIISKPKGKGKPDAEGVHGALAEKGWDYRIAYFEDFNGSYYRVTISVAKSRNRNVVYNIGRIERRSHPDVNFYGSSAARGARHQEASPMPTIAQESGDVKNNFSELKRPQLPRWENEVTQRFAADEDRIDWGDPELWQCAGERLQETKPQQNRRSHEITRQICRSFGHFFAISIIAG